VAASDAEQYGCRIRELEKVAIFSQIRSLRSLPDSKQDTTTHMEAAEADRSTEMLIAQLLEENTDLKTRVSELSFDLEEMRANQTEKMETSFASPVRMSLGAAFHKLNIEFQGEVGGGISDLSFENAEMLEDIVIDNQRVRVYECCAWYQFLMFIQEITIHAGEHRHSMHPTSSPEQLGVFNAPTSSRDTAENAAGSTNFDTSDIASVPSSTSQVAIVMRLGALILGSLSLVPHVAGG
jgi:hypothetical protein